jgi:hypothetical protein
VLIVMKQLVLILAVALGAFIQCGCTIACGPIRRVQAQRLSLMATSSDRFLIRVQPDSGPMIETPVPKDGRVEFDVPISSRASTIYVLGLPVYHHPLADQFRVITVVREERTIRKLSAREIGQLPVDADGYHILRIHQ